MKKSIFCKSLSNNQKADLNKLGIDIATLDVSENYKGRKYIASEMQYDLFLYFEGTELLGILKGNKRNKSYSDFENYNIHFLNYGENLGRNRKNYDRLATDVVRIKEKELYKTNFLSKNRKNAAYVKTNKLFDRLQEYKRNKYNTLTDDKMQNIIETTLTEISSRLFQEMPKKYKSIIWYGINDYSDMLEAFSKLIKEYISMKKSYDEACEIFKETKLKYLNNSKVSIINFNKKLMA